MQLANKNWANFSKYNRTLKNYVSMVDTGYWLKTFWQTNMYIIQLATAKILTFCETIVPKFDNVPL